MSPSRLLPLNIVSDDVLEILAEPLKRSPRTVIVSALREVRGALDACAASRPDAATTVDLIGHSTRDHRLLRIGGAVIDGLDPGVLRFFQEIADSRVLQRMNAVSLRLLGCETAVSPSGQRTLRALSRILGIRVYGSRKRLSGTHHTDSGFNPVFEDVLVEAAQLGAGARPRPFAPG